MANRVCYICKQTAAGFASVWSKAEGERWYCHGDEDESPTCYERANWTPDSVALDARARGWR